MRGTKIKLTTYLCSRNSVWSFSALPFADFPLPTEFRLKKLVVSSVQKDNDQSRRIKREEIKRREGERETGRRRKGE